MDAELEAVRALAALLPPEQARYVVECWDIGEQEAALDCLVTTLAEAEIALDGDERAQIAVTAECWGVREAITPTLRRCLSRDGGGVRLIDEREPLVSAELEGLVVVPWITCTRCSQLLSRAHVREPWGDLSYQPVHYVLGSVRLFGPEDVWAAFTALHPCPTTPGL